MDGYGEEYCKAALFGAVKVYDWAYQINRISFFCGYENI